MKNTTKLTAYLFSLLLCMASTASNAASSGGVGNSDEPDYWCAKMLVGTWDVMDKGQYGDHIGDRVKISKIKHDSLMKVTVEHNGSTKKYKGDDFAVTCTTRNVEPYFAINLSGHVTIEKCEHRLVITWPYNDSGYRHDKVGFKYPDTHGPGDCTNHLDISHTEKNHPGSAHGHQDL